MDPNDPDDPEAAKLTRYQYNAMLLEPTEHVEPVKDADCAYIAFQVLEQMRIMRKWKAGKLTAEEVVEQLKQIGVLF